MHVFYALSLAAIDLNGALGTKYGPLGTSATVLSMTSNKPKVSGYTVFTYSGGGFTPGGEVLISFGPPDGADVATQLVAADSAGNISGSMTMPTPDKMTLGTNLLSAVDYRPLRASIDAAYADPSKKVTAKIGGKLIEVVPDANPPVTKLTIVGARDEAGVFRGDTVLKFDATDDISGVAYTETSSDNGVTWTKLGAGQTSITLKDSGTFRIKFRSTDKAGNVEDARDSSVITIKKHVMLNASSSTAQPGGLIATTGSNVTGEMHSNSNWRIMNNTGLIASGKWTATQAGSTLSGNTNMQAPTLQSGVPQVVAFKYDINAYKQRATIVSASSLTIGSSNKPPSGSIIYAALDLIINAVDLATGEYVFVAGRDIKVSAVSGTPKSADRTNGVILFAGRNITLDSTGQGMTGLVLAPNGKILVRATNSRLDGALVGLQVEVNGATTWRLAAAPAFPTGTYPVG